MMVCEVKFGGVGVGVVWIEYIYIMDVFVVWGIIVFFRGYIFGYSLLLVDVKCISREFSMLKIL